MSLSSIGDLSRSFQLRQDTTRLKSELSRLTRELSSGVSEDLAGRLKGDFGPLAGIERGLSRMESYQAVIAEHRLVVSSFQTGLANLRELGDISGTLLTVPDTGDPTLVRNAGSDTLSRLSSALSNLNTQVGGRSIYAGVQTDQPAVAELDSIMVALESEIAIAGATTAADIDTVVSTWFATGGGFDSSGYIGGPPIASGVQLSDGEIAPPPITAGADEIRDYLAAMAMGGLLGRTNLAISTDEQSALARLAGQRLFEANSGLVDLQSMIGTVEAQVQRANVEVAAEMDGLTIGRSELIEIDPFDVAVRLQSTETQLQTLYSITARLSRLSLVQYL